MDACLTRILIGVEVEIDTDQPRITNYVVRIRGSQVPKMSFNVANRKGRHLYKFYYYST